MRIWKSVRVSEGWQGKQNEKNSPPFPPPHLPMAWEAWDFQRSELSGDGVGGQGRRLQ